MTSCLVLSGMGFVPSEQPSDWLQVDVQEPNTDAIFAIRVHIKLVSPQA